MSDTPNQVRVALGVLALHGAPVTEHEYRELMQPVDCTVTASYLMMQGYLRHCSRREDDSKLNYGRYLSRPYDNTYELTERGLEALK